MLCGVCVAMPIFLLFSSCRYEREGCWMHIQLLGGGIVRVHRHKYCFQDFLIYSLGCLFSCVISYDCFMRVYHWFL